MPRKRLRRTPQLYSAGAHRKAHLLKNKKIYEKRIENQCVIK